jgi:hypothetical protein
LVRAREGRKWGSEKLGALSGRLGGSRGPFQCLRRSLCRLLCAGLAAQGMAWAPGSLQACKPTSQSDHCWPEASMSSSILSPPSMQNNTPVAHQQPLSSACANQCRGQLSSLEHTVWQHPTTHCVNSILNTLFIYTRQICVRPSTFTSRDQSSCS